jgi:Flp pilus assembly protein TadG
MLSKSFGAQVTRGAAILKTLRAFRKDESGASLVIVGLTLPVLIGAMGLAAEVSYWQLHHRAMQNAADAAVIAAATNNNPIISMKPRRWLQSMGFRMVVAP